jgi:hypothetical protein
MVEIAAMFEDGANGALGTKPVVEISSPPHINCPLCVIMYVAASLQSPVIEAFEEI